MADPEQLLGALPEESPPPEIVLAAVRVFRYRVVAVVAIAVVLAVVGVVWANKLAANGRFLAEVGDAHYTGGVLEDAAGVGGFATVDGITLTVWEVVRSADGRTIYVHVLGWDEERRNPLIDVRDPRFGGVRARQVGGEGDPRQAADRSLMNLWFAVARTAPGDLSFDIEVIDLPRQGDPEVIARVPFEIAMEQGMP